jgi:hypothetical protein
MVLRVLFFYMPEVSGRCLYGTMGGKVAVLNGS